MSQKFHKESPEEGGSKVVRKVLKNKPLIESIFEMRWELKERVPGIWVDPHYKIIIGRIYDKLNVEYPFYETLPAASIPEEMVGYIVQHRFRKNEQEWPLIQIGPGIITVNDTEGYIWEDFEKNVLKAINVLFEVYPDSRNNLKIKNLLLRYIDGINFNFDSDSIFEFLANNMKTKISLCPELFKTTGVDTIPFGFDWRFAFRSTKPAGIVNLRFVRGKKKDSDSLIWETMIQSVSNDFPKNIIENIQQWLTEAHNLTDDWFFKLIEGDLERRFE
jgi:uncharacterized protein (TIGR04255 family)